MKKLPCIILLLLCLTANVSQSQSFKMFGQLLNPHWSSDGLVFYWRGIEAVEVVDESYFGNNGTITGATWVGNGLSFDGTGDYVTTPNLALSTYNLTIIGFVKCTTDPTGTIFCADGSTPFKWFLFNIRETSKLYCYIGDGTSYTPISTDTIADGEWHHCAVTVSSTGLVTIYFDGVNVKEQQAGYADTAFTGRIVGNVYRPLQGFLNHLTVYNRALSASEIAALYLNPNLPMQQNPIWLLQPSVVPSGIIPIIQAHARRRRAG